MAIGSSYMQRTQTAGNQKTWTVSMWVKRGDVETQQCLMSVEDGAAYVLFKFNASEYFEWRGETGAARFITTRVFRDPGAWYHIVVACDTTESVEADRFKIYINGVQETAFGTETYPALDSDTYVNKSGGYLRIGSDEVPGSYLNGCMSWVQLVDGAALAPTEFGSVDATSGIWKIKPGAYATPGTNGFCLAMEDRSNLDLDTSSNAHTFTTTGTITATYDNPSNNFSTMNRLNAFESAYSFTNGNTSVWTSAQWSGMCSSLQMIKGKWYVEFKLTGSGVQAGVFFGAGTGVSIGTRQMNQANYGYASYQADGFERQAWGSNKVTNDSSTAGYGTTMAENDIGMIALDTTNGIIWTGVNGTWDNSATTGEIASSDISNSMFNRSGYSPGMVPGYYAFTCAVEGTSITGLVNWNFGNGYFGTTAVTSAEADGAGIGAFEYAPPTGYYALCTKNIKAYGG